jgi:hypothetical protein
VKPPEDAAIRRTIEPVATKLVARGEGQPLMVVAMTNAGMRKGSSAMTFFVAWSMAEASLERPLGDGGSLSAAVREYSTWWKQSERQSWRELAAFRQAFGESSDPREFAAQARELRAVQSDTKHGQAMAALGQLTLA